MSQKLSRETVARDFSVPPVGEILKAVDSVAVGILGNEIITGKAQLQWRQAGHF